MAQLPLTYSLCGKPSGSHLLSALNGGRELRSYIFWWDPSYIAPQLLCPSLTHRTQGHDSREESISSGRMIGLGSGRRAGMIPAGYKGTMRVVSKFQSLLERLTIGKFSLGQKTKNQKQQQKLTHNNKRKQNPTKNIENCRDSYHVGSGDKDQKGQSFSKINKISGIFGKTHFTVHSFTYLNIH